MRIAMLSWESLHSIAVGGVAAHATELAAALGRKGHEVHVFTRRAPGQQGHDRIDGVHYHRCTYPPHPDFVDDVNNLCRAWVDRLFEVEDFVGRFDIVHAHDWLAANAMIWIKQGRGHRGVLTVHSTEYARCGNCLHNGRSQRIRAQERAGTYWADRVIAVSHATKKEIAWMYEVPEWKTSVVYNGVSPRRFEGSIDAGQAKRHYRIGPTDPTVLFCGRLTHQKGPDLLVEAIPSVLRYHGRAKFVFAGDGEMRGALETRARQLGAGDAVRFLGYRNGDELVRLFQMAETVCVPSRNEPFGIVVLEGWAAGKPAVVSQNGGTDEYVRHEENGLKIYPRPDSVAWGIGTLFADFDRARWMGENGRRLVQEQFTWDRIVEQMLAAYGQDLAQPSASARAEPPAEEAALPVPAQPEASPAVEPAPTTESADEACLPTGETAPRPESPAMPALVPVEVRLVLRPRRAGVSLSPSKAACRRILADAGLAARFLDRTIQIEGDCEAVFGAVGLCCRRVEEQGEAQVTVVARTTGAAEEAPPRAESPALEGEFVPVGIGDSAAADGMAHRPPGENGAMFEAALKALCAPSPAGGGNGDR